ncbi:MAG: hypothetical protein GXO16_07945 [Epsilonproteobacteria bacterium]|nr:hypothetical protein [Campylobacterota bacterium]
MRDVAMIQQHLDEYIEKMKKKEIEPVEFYKGIMKVLAEMDVTNEDLQGVTPQLLGFINGLIRNMKNKG